LVTTKLGFSFWAALPVSGIIAGIAGFLLAVPSLKVAALYLVMTTIGFSMIVWLMMLQWEGLTNGPNGIIGIPTPSIGGWAFDSPAKYYYLVLGCAILAVWLMSRIVKSSIGLRLMAVFDQEEAAKAVGVNTAYFRVLAFVVSSVFAGVAGSLYAHYVTFIHPENFDIWISVIFLVMAVFGGQRSIPGITASTVILTFATEYFRILGDYRMIGYGVFLAVCMIYFPEGLSKLKLGPVGRFFSRPEKIPSDESVHNRISKG
jgi:branched-chain amino acid transport system permease protein